MKPTQKNQMSWYKKHDKVITLIYPWPRHPVPINPIFVFVIVFPSITPKKFQSNPIYVFLFYE